MKTEYFDLSGNLLFSGTIPESLYNSTMLQELVLSENLLTGTISTGIGKLIHLEKMMLDRNRLLGVIPTEVGALQKLEHLSLKDNRIGGFFPSEIGNLKVLKTLELNHNELKGEVPRELGELEDLHRALLHANELSGIISFKNTSNERVLIADCGFPSTLVTPIECEDCTMCCNGEGNCQKNVKHLFWRNLADVFFVMLMSLAFIGCYLYWIEFQFRVRLSSDSFSSGDGSVYFLLLADSPFSWIIGISTIAFQLFLGCFFGNNANDLTSRGSDWIYTWVCPPTTSNCIDNNDVDELGWLFFFIIMFYSLLSEYVKSLKLILAGVHARSGRLFFIGLHMLVLSTVTIVSSMVHLKATSDTNTGIVKDTIILLLITDIDEWLFAGLDVLAPIFIREQTADATSCLRLMGFM